MPKVAWTGVDDGGVTARWKANPPIYLYNEKVVGYVMEFFIPAERLGLGQLKPEDKLRVSITCVDDGHEAERLRNVRQTLSVAWNPKTWGEIRLVADAE
jgi:hypothetical protein